MIILLSVLLVIAIGAFYAGYRTGYSAGFVYKEQEEPFDEEKWMNA